MTIDNSNLYAYLGTTNTDDSDEDTPKVLTSSQSLALIKVLEHGEVIAADLNAFFDTIPSAKQSDIADFLNEKLGLVPSVLKVGFALAVRNGCFPGLYSARKAGTKRIDTITFSPIEVSPPVVNKRGRKPSEKTEAPAKAKKISVQEKRVARLISEIERACTGISPDEKDEIVNTLTVARDILAGKITEQPDIAAE